MPIDFFNIICHGQLEPDQEGEIMDQLIDTVERFLKKKATIGQLRQALKQAKEIRTMPTKDIKVSPRITADTKAFMEYKFKTASAGAELLLATCADVCTAAPVAAFKDPAKGLTYIVRLFSHVYRYEMHRVAEKFSADEFGLMVEAMKNAELLAGMAGKQLLLRCGEAMDFEKLHEKWDVHPAAVKDKILDLEEIQATCLEIWCRAFWEMGNEDITEYTKELIQ